MRIANLAESTQTAYLFEIERLAKHYGISPAGLTKNSVVDSDRGDGWDSGR